MFFSLPISAHYLGLTVLVVLSFIQCFDAKSSYAQNEINHKSSRFNYNNNYCAQDLCPANKKHIACANKGNFGPKCTKDVKLIEMDGYTKRLILHLHNHHRSVIAQGNTVSNFRFFPDALNDSICVSHSLDFLLPFAWALSNGTTSWHTLQNSTQWAAKLNTTNAEIRGRMHLLDRTWRWVGSWMSTRSTGQFEISLVNGLSNMKTQVHRLLTVSIDQTDLRSDTLHSWRTTNKAEVNFVVTMIRSIEWVRKINNYGNNLLLIMLLNSWLWPSKVY